MTRMSYSSASSVASSPLADCLFRMSLSKKRICEGSNRSHHRLYVSAFIDDVYGNISGSAINGSSELAIFIPGSDIVKLSQEKHTSIGGPASLPSRTLPTLPERVLDAPSFRDDFYLHLIDWSSDGTLAIALDASVYLWDEKDGEARLLLGLSECSSSRHRYVSCIKWMSCGKMKTVLCVGTSDGEIAIWDTDGPSKMRTLKHPNKTSNRISSMSCSSFILSVGSKDGSIGHYDVRRKADPLIVQSFHSLTSNLGEVCGLQWRPDGELLASGGNDNCVHIWERWSVSSSTGPLSPLTSFYGHCSAVKVRFARTNIGLTYNSRPSLGARGI